MKIKLLIFFLLIINHFTFSFISNTEKEALIDLYKHTDGANWFI